MRIRLSYFILLIAVGLTVLTAACKKDRVLTSGGSLKFSVDTLTFDTVFTAEGSFTMSFKIYNPQGEKVVLSSVGLQQGSKSYFHLNVDGFSGNSLSNITIQPHDSVYVFATVNIDPKNQDNPYVIEDQLIATLNGKQFSVPFIAYGQDAYYIVDSEFTITTPNPKWGASRPYVVMGTCIIDSGVTLTLQPKCRVYMHANARIYVAGSLQSNPASASADDTVVFQGDRLDRFYFGNVGLPGEWGGLYFAPGTTNNILRNTVLENCGASTTVNTTSGPATFLDAAIQTNPGTKLTMDKCIVRNSRGYGLISFGSTVTATNCLIAITGAEALALVQGGNYNITNCTFADYSTNYVSHDQNSTAAILNYFDTSQTGYISGAMNAVITNCIFWGSLDSEMFCNARDVATVPYNVTFNNCIIKGSQKTIQNFTTTTACLFNRDPLFVNTDKWDFHLSSGSPAKGAATTTGPSDDLEWKPRAGHNDIGCYIAP